MKSFIKPGAAIALCAIVLMAGSAPISAHHSASMFDFSKTLTLTGTVVEVRWTNPHVTLLVNGKVSEADENADWLLEMSSPSNLIRVSNWQRTTVKIGDHVKVQIAPLRDGSAKGGNRKTLTLIDTGESFTPNIRDREEPGLQ
jgi:Family of unknown function (DUF6152)